MITVSVMLVPTRLRLFTEPLVQYMETCGSSLKIPEFPFKHDLPPDEGQLGVDDE